MEWLVPAVIATLTGTAIMTVVFLHLYSQEKQSFLGIWAASWGVYALRFVFQLWQLLTQDHPLLSIAYQAASLISGTLLLWGTYRFMSKRLPRYWLVIGTAILVWIPVASFGHFSFAVYTAPTFLFLCFAYIRTGLAFIQHPGLAGAGKKATGWSFIIWGIHKADYPFLRPVLWIAPWGYLLGAVLELSVAIGMLIYYFQLTKEELRKREAQFRAIIDNAAVGIDLVSPQGNFILANQKIAELLESTPEALRQMTILDVTHPDDRKANLSALDDLLRGKIGTYHLEKRFLRADGSYFWADLSTSPVHNRNGEVESVVGVISDITQRKQVEQALENKRRQQQKLIETARRLPESLDLDQVLEQIATGARQIIDASGAIIFLLTNDGQTLQPVAANLENYEDEILSTQVPVEESLTGQAVKTRTGLVFNQTAGNPSGYLIPGTNEDPTDRVIVAPLLLGDQALGAIWLSRLGEPFNDDDLALVETYASFAVTAIKNAQAHEKLQTEIEERALVEEALRIMEERFRLAFRTSPDAININRLRDGVYIDTNDGFTALTGYSREEAVGRSSLEINIWQDVSDRDKLVAGLKESGTVRNLEAKFCLKDGSVRTGLMSATVMSLNGEPHILSFTRDIEDRKQAELALQESEERYRNLFENNHTVMLIIDPLQGRILDANPAACRFYGYSRAHLTGLLISELNTLSEHEVYVEMQRAKREERQYFLFTHRLAGGETRKVEVYSGPITIKGEKLLYSIVHDVTDRIQREREMETLLQVATALRTAGKRADMFPVILNQVKNLLQAEKVSLSLYNPLTGNIIVEENLRSENGVAPPEHFAGIPLIWQEQTIGALTINRCAVIHNADLRILSAIGEITANALQRALLHEETQRNLERLNALHTIDKAITANVAMTDTLEIILEQVMAQLHVEAVDILLLDESGENLSLVAARGLNAPSSLNLRVGASLAGTAVLERRQVTNFEQPESAEIPRYFSPLLGNSNHTRYFAVPLVVKDKIKGVIELYSNCEKEPEREWYGFLDTLARQTAIALDNALLFKEIQQSNAELTQAYDTTLEGWARALELRDKETEGHAQRVLEMTLGLAREMGMDGDQLVHLRRGALLHDIGKMGIPDSILLKPGPLTPEEWEVMRMHPVFAYELLAGIPYLRPALDVPYCHHEKWNGSGYPRGLAGEEIPLTARIFAIVDVWDALSSDRPYRGPWPRHMVEAYIHEQAGEHFDPQVVDAFFAYLAKIPD